jgi:hypothetical protein
MNVGANRKDNPMPPEYSKSPLVKKLAIKPKTKMIVLNAPDGYRDMLGDLPEGATLSDSFEGTFDWIQVFVTKQADLYAQLPGLKAKLAPDGILWITFPRDKKKTDLSRNAIMPSAIHEPFGLEPNANTVINDDWTAYRLKHYKG